MNNNNINNNDTNTNNIIAPPHHALLPAGQKLLAILQQKSELPPYVDSKINEELNAMAEEFLTKIRSSVVDVFFEDDLGDAELEYERRKEQQQKNNSIVTIVDEDWYTVEKKFEKAIRFFPDTLRQMRYEYYPIQHMTTTILFRSYHLYNLQFISLVPLVVRLGIELQQFDEDLRSGLLLQDDDEEGEVIQYSTVLYSIVQYLRMKDEENNKLVDEVFFSVWEQLRETNFIRKEDIKKLKLLSLYFNPDTESDGQIFSVRNFRYLVDWDPTVLCVPLIPEDGNWLPIHFCAENEYRTGADLIEVVRAGLQYHPEKLGHIFTTGTQRFELKSDDDEDDNIAEEVEYDTFVGTPFELACEVYGQPTVVEAVLNCFAEYCDSSRTSSTTDTGGNTTDNDTTTTHVATESSLLLSTVTDQSIHLDGLYILLRNNPVDALLKLHQNLSLPNHRGPGRSPIKTNNETNVDPDITEVKTNQIDNNARTVGTETGEKKRKYEAIGSSDL